MPDLTRCARGGGGSRCAVHNLYALILRVLAPFVPHDFQLAKDLGELCQADQIQLLFPNHKEEMSIEGFTKLIGNLRLGKKVAFETEHLGAQRRGKWLYVHGCLTSARVPVVRA